MNISWSTIIFYLTKIGAFIVAFCAPFLTLIHTLIFIVIIDIITSLIVQMRMKKGFTKKVKVIESRKLRKSAIKLAFYILFMVSIFAVSEAILPGSMLGVWVMKLVFFSFASVELVSISANLNNLTGETIFTKTIKKVINAITSALTKKLD